MKKYIFKNPQHHIVDRSPEMVEFLQTNPTQSNARHLRNILMFQHSNKVRWALEDNGEEEVVIDLFAQTQCHLSLVNP